MVVRGVPGNLVPVLTIYDRNRVLWGVWFGQKKVRDFTTDKIGWLGKISSPNSKVVKFVFAPDVGGYIECIWVLNCCVTRQDYR